MLESSTPHRLIDADPTEFEAFYGRIAFDFAHRLAGHPLFELPRLIDLAKAMNEIPGGIVYNASKVDIGQRWDQTPKPKGDVIRTLREIDSADGWVALKRADHFPAYRALLDACLEEMEVASSRKLREFVKFRNCIIFVNSPHRITNYHIDREWNCLLQVRGTKRVSVFDRSDRDVLPEEELERFWTVDNNAAVWRPQFADRARVFDLEPGRGLHIPVNAPHWVRNGPDVSVSVSVNFHMHDALLGYVYRTNYWMRRMGLNPMPPGRSQWRDAVKGRGYATVRAIGNRIRRKPV